METPIAFTVKLDSYSILPTYLYKFSFDEFPDRNTNIYKNQASPLIYSIVFNVSEHSNMGPYTAKVEVWYCILQTPFILIGSDTTSFSLSSEYIYRVYVVCVCVPLFLEFLGLNYLCFISVRIY